MEILEILKRKEKELRNSSSLLEVTLEADEVTILGDSTQLRFLKVVEPLGRFERSSSRFSCYEKAKKEGGIYRTLEFLTVCNPILQKSVSKVFGRNGLVWDSH